MYSILKIEKNELINFINSEKNWKEILSNEDGPYALKIKQSLRENESNLWMFSYNQILTNWKYKVPYFARGIILEIIDDKVTRVVRHAFDKFFNSHEGYADKIDWSSEDTFVSMKMDGSIIALYNYNDTWHWSTSGMFHADDANLSEIFSSATDGTENSKSFMDLIQHCISKQKIDLSIFDKTHTYSFELTSPSNRIVTPYSETKLTFIGERDNSTDEEIDILKSPIRKYIPTPEMFKFSSEKEAQEAVDKLTNLTEGFVIRGSKREDGSFNRQKMKSKEYVKCHHIRGENNFSHKQLFEVTQANETGEVEAYFPEVKEKIKSSIESFNLLRQKVLVMLDLGKEKLDELIKEDPLYHLSDVSVKKKYSMFVNSNTIPTPYRHFMYYVFKDNYKNEIEKYLRSVSWKDYKSLQSKINSIEFNDGEKK